MVSIGGAILVGVLVAVHAVIAAVTIRLLRVRLSRSWGPVVLGLGIVPIVLVISTLVVGGAFGLGPDLRGRSIVLFLLVAVPLGLGFAVDYLWMPAPEAVDLPAGLEE